MAVGGVVGARVDGGRMMRQAVIGALSAVASGNLAILSGWVCDRTNTKDGVSLGDLLVIFWGFVGFATFAIVFCFSVVVVLSPIACWIERQA